LNPLEIKKVGESNKKTNKLTLSSNDFPPNPPKEAKKPPVLLKKKKSSSTIKKVSQQNQGIMKFLKKANKGNEDN
jgi:hypothetical protein